MLKVFLVWERKLCASLLMTKDDDRKWPSARTVRAFPPQREIKLKRISYTFSSKRNLQSLQLIFTGDIESPFVGNRCRCVQCYNDPTGRLCFRADTNPTVSIDVPQDKVIRSVSLRMQDKQQIKGLKFTDQQGQVILIEDRGTQN